MKSRTYKPAVGMTSSTRHHALWPLVRTHAIAARRTTNGTRVLASCHKERGNEGVANRARAEMTESWDWGMCLILRYGQPIFCAVAYQCASPIALECVAGSLIRGHWSADG